MNIMELVEQLNRLGEQEKVEAKTGEKIGKSILETVCAFANEPDLGGGYLLLGVKRPDEQYDQPYQPVGVKDPERLLEDLVSQCRTIFNKPIEIETAQVRIDNKIVVGVFVPEANNGAKPVYFRNQGLPRGAYRRMGSSDVRCTDDDLLILYQNKNIESYDNTVLDDTDWKDIDLDAIESYRREHKAIQPDAAALQWPDQELLQSLGCLKQVNGHVKPTLAGILLFGTKLVFRRLLSDMRIEYIRVPGKQWMSDADNRYTASIDIRGPLISSIRRAEAAVIDDLPQAFSLPEGSLQREDIPVIPFKVIREAVVNAVMHRDYRVHQAIQIIRYANRIEIRNPGYSLIAEEHLGEPGSKTRNLKLSEVLREIRFAEKKGTGIGLMRKQMQEAGLSPPLFESDRSRDLFVATFLFHHFLSDEDIAWLANFKEYHLSDEQAKALIFIREVGAINNAAYRNLNQVDTLTASTSLRQLRDLGLIDAKSRGVATYYVPGSKLVAFGKRHKLEDKRHQLEGKRHQLEGKRHQLEDDTHQLEEDEVDIHMLPVEIQEQLRCLSKKAPKPEVRKVILALCNFKEMTATEIAAYLQRRDKRRLVRSFLSPMIKENLLEYKYPQMPGHPQQKYSTKSYLKRDTTK